MISLDDRVHMSRALALAAQGIYSTMPNPRVGCVIVSGGAVVGEGWHRRAGEPHAEVNALTAAGARAVGGTAYVSLEPCSHTGKTGPCCDALIAAGVARVVYAMEDPNPQVSGRGLARLRSAGVVVDGPLLEAQALELNAGFVKRMRYGRPLVRCKLAMSLDGRTAMASGESQWITGPAARADVQRLRARSCAIVTGVGSVLADDSSLAVREGELTVADPGLAAAVQPLRVVLDSERRLDAGARVIASAASEDQPETLWVHAEEAGGNEASPPGVEQTVLAGDDGRVDLPALLDELGRRQCNEVLVEAGAQLAGAFVRAHLVDEMIIYMAPTLLGSGARPLLDLPLEFMSERFGLKIRDMTAVGGDWRITAVFDS